MLTDAKLHVTIAAKDLERARTWYSEKLGWAPIRELPGVLVYEVGGELFIVYETEFAGTAQNTVASWQVEDVPTEVARLRDRGVVFEELDLGDLKTSDGIATDEVGARTAWFRDADGNWIAMGDGTQEQWEAYFRKLGIAKAPPPARRSLAPMLAASDIARARAWYAEKLGLTPYVEEGDGLLYLDGATRFTVYLTGAAGTAKNTVAAWWVDDARSTVAELKAHGVRFEEYDFGDARTVDGILEDEDGLSAWFKDSEGNILGVGQYAELADLMQREKVAAPSV